MRYGWYISWGSLCLSILRKTELKSWWKTLSVSWRLSKCFEALWNAGQITATPKILQPFDENTRRPKTENRLDQVLLFTWHSNVVNCRTGKSRVCLLAATMPLSQVAIELRDRKRENNEKYKNVKVLQPTIELPESHRVIRQMYCLVDDLLFVFPILSSHWVRCNAFYCFVAFYSGFFFCSFLSSFRLRLSYLNGFKIYISTWHLANVCIFE